MKLITQNIRNGAHKGEVVWVTQYNRPDIHKKALRNVPPTQCIIKSIDDCTKKVYYSTTYFAPLKKDGTATSKVISPVDNTGYRSFCGNEINVFTTEAEANECWNAEIDDVIERMMIYAEEAQRQYIQEADRLSDTKL